MIPFIYTLREGIRFQRQQGSVLVISETPLNILRASEQAYQVLRRCDGSYTLEEIASQCNISEEQAFKLCDYFNKRAIVEISPSKKEGRCPFASVIIPVKDRRNELKECLESLFALDYPEDKMEVIVVDDGSSDGTSDLARTYPCVVITNSQSQGQSFCRNQGAKMAQGEILAFLDSDCVPEKTWLRELVVHFEWERIGAVGGYVDGYFDVTALDRYEKAFSPLNLGKHSMVGTNNESTLYVPTCNLLVRRQAYAETGGISNRMHVGEDVDFCWRLRNKGYDMLYVPRGTVYHKHRSSLGKMLKRRFDYGTSEAILYGIHSEKKKTVQLPLIATCSFLSIVGALITLSILPLLASVNCFALEVSMKIWRIRKSKIHLGLWRILFSVARSHFSFFYFTSFHLIRYYMVALICLGFFFHSVWYAFLLTLLLSSLVDYCSKRPRLGLPLFLFYYTVDHLSYQLGVFAGCLRKRSFGSYSLRIMKKVMTNYTPG
jgi:mycofactocin system glycosyltransferase